MGHRGGSSPELLLHSRLLLSCAASCSTCASNCIIRLWISSSISTKVALGCARRHSLMSVRISSLFCNQASWSIAAATFPSSFKMEVSYHLLFCLDILLQNFGGHPLVLAMCGMRLPHETFVNTESGLAPCRLRRGRVPSKAFTCSSLHRGNVHCAWGSRFHQTVVRRLSRGARRLDKTRHRLSRGFGR